LLTLFLLEVENSKVCFKEESLFLKTPANYLYFI